MPPMFYELSFTPIVIALQAVLLCSGTNPTQVKSKGQDEGRGGDNRGVRGKVQTSTEVDAEQPSIYPYRALYLSGSQRTQTGVLGCRWAGCSARPYLLHAVNGKHRSQHRIGNAAKASHALLLCTGHVPPILLYCPAHVSPS